jgi:hypothetical protein
MKGIVFTEFLEIVVKRSQLSGGQGGGVVFSLTSKATASV